MEKPEYRRRHGVLYKKTHKIAWVRQTEIECAICHKKFLTKHFKSQTCSPKCRAKFWWGKIPKEKRWRKSRLHRKGYIYLRITGRKGEFLEHRVIMEKVMKRKLRSDEFVHHINGKTNDNRVKNLIVMTRGDHNSHHKREEAASRTRNKSGRFI